MFVMRFHISCDTKPIISMPDHKLALTESDIFHLLRAKQRCDQKINTTDNHLKESGVQYCESTWDSFVCWPATPVGQVAFQTCPKLAVILNKDAKSEKECLRDGTWGVSNYTNCLLNDFPDHLLDSIDLELGGDFNFDIRVMYHVGYCMTIVALIIALAIFGYFRSLRCLRNSIHCNLLCAFLLNGVAWLVFHNTGRLFVYSQPMLFNIIVVLSHYFHNVPFYWMFIEGLYLFTIIVWTFSATKIRLWYYLVFGWGVPIIPTLVWAFVKMKVVEESLILNSDYDYIMHGPVLLLLTLNVFFITAIIWILLTKLRASSTLETRQSRKATKATVVLFPLLGVTYILFLKAPTRGDLEIVFLYINSVLQSLQGLFVAMIYCFFNGEVRTLVWLKFSALQDSRALSRYTRSSLFGSPRRSSCYAMATTTSNGRNNNAVGGATTSVADSTLAVDVSNNGLPAGEETTIMVVCGENSTTPCTNGDQNQKTKILRQGKADVENNAAMMENML